MMKFSTIDELNRLALYDATMHAFLAVACRNGIINHGDETEDFLVSIIKTLVGEKAISLNQVERLLRMMPNPPIVWSTEISNKNRG
jgi:hypothetical protein